MTDSTTNISGGIDFNANDIHIGGDAVGRDKIVQITNYIAQQAQIAKERQPLRVLAVIASPVAGERESDPPPASLSGRAEWKALRASTKIVPMLLARLRPPTALALRTIGSPNNKGAFNIVHFICHGLPGALALEDERSLMTIVNANDLAAALKEGEVQLAVINACYSAAGEEESIAQALVDAGVRSVVAHRWPLIDPAAVLFSQALYRELAAGRSLRAAFDQAVRETTAEFAAEKGNAVLLGDEALCFPRPDNAEESKVIEGAALPDEAARFFGRGHELIALADIFAHADLRGAALTGIGGIGKSALAFEAADRLAWRFDDRVAYVRAAEFGFKAEDALIDLARGLGLQDSTNPIGDLRDFVNRQPCLLLFDNMERAGAELYRLADFVSSLNLDAGSQFLFTLRPPLSDRFHDVREINLHTGLDERAALDFVRTTAYNLNAAREWQNVNEARALVQRVNGHPELMRLAVYRSLKTPYAKVKQEVSALSGKLNEALGDLIGKQAKGAGELAQTALMRLTIFPQPRMIVEAAQAACGEAADGLDALVENGVIALEQDDAQRYGLHPTALDYARSKQDARGMMQDAQIRAAECYADFVKQNHNYEGFRLVEPEITNVLYMAEAAYNAEAYEPVMKIADDLILGQGYLYVRSEWQVGKKLLMQAIDAAQKSGNEKYEASFLHELGIIESSYGNFDEALRLYQQSLEIKERLGNLKGKAATLHEIARVSATRGDLDGALRLYQQSLDAWERLGDAGAQGKAATLSQVGEIYRAKGDWEQATRTLVSAIDIDKEIGDYEGLAYDIAKLGQIAEHNMELEEAARLYRESIGYFERLGSPVAEQVRQMLARVERRLR